MRLHCEQRPQVGRLVLRLWRAWARLKAMKHQLEQMTEGVPQWIAGGNLEKPWILMVKTSL